MKKKISENREREIDEAVREINNLQDEAKMFKAVKALNRKRFENPFVHDKEGKHVRKHSLNHFYGGTFKTTTPFYGEPERLTKPITVNEVSRAINKLNNNRAAGPDLQN